MTSTREWTFGPHWAHLLQPDVLWVKFDGPTTLEDAKNAVEVYREACAQEPKYALFDISKSSIDSPARKYLADSVDASWFKGAVYVGAPFMLKTITKALTVMILFNAKQPYEVEFADDEAGALRHVEKWRSQHVAKTG